MLSIDQRHLIFAPKSGKIVSKIVLDQCQYFVTVIEEKNTFFQVRLQLLLPCGPLWVWGTSASTYGWGRQRRYELWNNPVIKDLNNSSPSFPSWRAWEDPPPQSVRAGLVPQDGGDQVSNIITTFILMIVVNKDEEDDARSWAVCLRLWHPHRGLPALYPVSTLSVGRRITKCQWAFIAWVSETLDSRHLPKAHKIAPNTPFSGEFAQLSLVTEQEDAQS